MVGPGWCALCQVDSETNLHLFVECPYTKKMWENIETSLRLAHLWNKRSVPKNVKHWFSCRELKGHRSVHFLVMWRLWIAQNKVIFEDNFFPNLSSCFPIFIFSSPFLEN
jgi:hypothetical protein